MWRTFCISWCGVQYIVSFDVTYILFFRHTVHFLLRGTSSISWCDILPVFPAVQYNTLYFLVWRTYCFWDIHSISWYGVYIIPQIYIVFPDIAYILYYLMWRTLCISWCGVQYILSFVVAYSLFCIHRWHFLIKRTSCLSWCGLLFVFPDCSSDIHSISWYGVYIVPQIYIEFPDMAYILNYLVWRTLCISWCGVQYIVSSDVAHISFFRHRWYFLIKRTSCISWCGEPFVFPGVAYNILYLLMLRICCSSDIQSIFCYDAHPIFPNMTYFLQFLMWSTTHCISQCGVHFVFPDVAYNILYRLMWRIYCSSDIQNISWYGVHPAWCHVLFVFPDVAYDK